MHNFDRTFLFILVETQILPEVQFFPHASLRFLFYLSTFFISIRNFFFDLFSVKEWYLVHVKKPYEQLLITKAHRN